MNDLRHHYELWAEPISLAAAGCLSPDEEREVRRHIETCSDCRERFRQLTQLCGVLAEAQLPTDCPEAAIVQQVMSVVASGDSERPVVRTQAETTHRTFLTRSLTTGRWIMRHPGSRVTAAAIFVLVIGGVALLFHGGGATPAFADFLQPILEAKTVRFKQTVEIKGPPPTTLESQWMVDATRSRMGMTAPRGLESVHITDWSKGKSLTLSPATKHATILEYGNTKNERNDPSTWLRLLQMARDNKTKNFHCEPLGEKQFAGRRVVGFRISADGGLSLDLWGDPRTGLPVCTESTAGMNGNMKSTLSDFVFNAETDESLFSVEPPAGYTVEHQKADTAADVEKDLIEMFRQFTKMTGGAFPKALDMQTVSWVFWKTQNIQMMWESITNSTFTGETNEGEKRAFEEQIGAIMDKMTDATMAGNTEQTRKFAEQMSKVTLKIVGPRVAQMTWESLAQASLKANEGERRKFTEKLCKIVEGDPNKVGEETSKIVNQMLWEGFAPSKLKAIEEKRHKFEELMLKMGGEKNEKQKVKDQFRKVFGDQMLKDVEAWEAHVEKAGKAREAGMLKTADDQKARSQEFMEAQRQIGRGVNFASQLPPSADAHYAGKGVSLGTADKPIFWYRPKDSKKYRVVYSDLSVRETDTPPSMPVAQPVPGPSAPKK